MRLWPSGLEGGGGRGEGVPRAYLGAKQSLGVRQGEVSRLAVTHGADGYGYILMLNEGIPCLALFSIM